VTYSACGCLSAVQSHSQTAGQGSKLDAALSTLVAAGRDHVYGSPARQTTHALAAFLTEVCGHALSCRGLHTPTPPRCTVQVQRNRCLHAETALSIRTRTLPASSPAEAEQAAAGYVPVLYNAVKCTRLHGVPPPTAMACCCWGSKGLYRATTTQRLVIVVCSHCLQSPQ
jgi:hypothetical protein